MTAPGEAPTAPQSWLQQRLGWLPADDREVLGIWLLSRLGMYVAVMATGWMFYRSQAVGDGSTVNTVLPFIDRWMNWDAYHFRSIAEGWYAPRDVGPPLEAFFPGFPFMLWLLSGFWIPHAAGGLIISAVAGGIAAVALRRLGDREGGPGVGRRAVLLLVLAPPAVFLAAPYTEAMFLAFAIPSWLAARQGRWAMAALLCAGASATRVSGLFLAAALVVEFLTSSRRNWRDAPWLAVSVAPAALYMAYLWRRTGDPLRWLHAQEEEWHRSFTAPWDALQHTIDAAFNRPDLPPDYGWQFRAEMIAMLVGVVLTVGLLLWRRWGEATWIGLQVIAFGTSYWFFSVPRATLLWWPLFIALAAITMRWRWTFWTYIAVCTPIMIVWTVAYTSGGIWTG